MSKRDMRIFIFFIVEIVGKRLSCAFYHGMWYTDTIGIYSSSESAFSVGDWVLTKWRSSIVASTLEIFVWLKNRLGTDDKNQS